MSYFLILASTYESVNIALCNEDNVIEADSISKQSASKDLVLEIAALLSRNSVTLADLDFCAVNQGPGPFTTLRTVIATANGLSFATGLPLVGVNELESFLQEYKNDAYPQTIILLNGFNFDLYYSMLNKDNTILIGCKNIDLLLLDIQNNYPDQAIRFIGNGAELYRDKIVTAFGPRAQIPDPLPESSSVEHIRLVGLQLWHDKKNISTQLQPLYLKTIKSK